MKPLIVPSPTYLARLAAQCEEGLKLISIKTVDLIQKWSAGVPKRAVEALRQKLSGEQYEQQDLADILTLLEDRLAPTNLEMSAALRNENLIEIERLVKTMDVYDVDIYRRRALHQNKIGVADILGQHCDGLFPIKGVLSAMDQDYPTETEICLSLFDNMSPEEQCKGWKSALNKASQSDRTDMILGMCSRAPQLAEPILQKIFGKALWMAAIKQNLVVINWLLAEQDTHPENIVVELIHHNHDRAADILALQLPIELMRRVTQEKYGHLVLTEAHLLAIDRSDRVKISENEWAAQRSRTRQRP